MSSGFSRHRRSGKILATFTSHEADHLRSLASQLIELLRNESAAPISEDPLEAMLDFSGPTVAPEDPVLLRLFPTAYPGDDAVAAEAAAEFRRYTETDLRNGKAAGAAALIDTLEEAGLADQPEDGVFIDVELDQALVLVWLRTFTDIRLAIGTRIGVEEDDHEHWHSLPEDDPAGWMYDLYEWVGLLQESLLHAIT